VDNGEDAEDILQDVFLGAMASLDALASVENIPAWIFSSVRNRVIDLWRKRKTRRQAGETEVSEETIGEILDATGLDPLDAVVRDEIADALADAIEALPPEQREVIEAQVLNGIGFRELSESTGISINTLTARKRYAVRRLAFALRDWIEH